jgi:hypothetical protein
MHHISLITTKGNQKSIGMTVLLFQGLATFKVPTGLRGTAARQDPDENSGHNSAGEYAQRIAFGHRLKLQRERRDLVGGRLCHVAGCSGGLAEAAWPRSIASPTVFFTESMVSVIVSLGCEGLNAVELSCGLEVVFMKFS